MTRLLTDGAESGDVSRASSSAGASANVAARVVGTYCYLLNNGTSPSSANFLLLSAASEWYLRFGILCNSTSQGAMITFLNGANTAGSIRMASFGNGVATCTVYDNVTLRATSSTFTMNTGEWHVFEVHFKHAANPNGVIEVKFDGTLVLSFTGATNSQSQIDRIQLNGIANQNVRFDDIAVNDTNGTMDNTWIGDGGVFSAQVPTATGTYAGFLASGSATTWQSTDEIPANSTDFMYSSVSGTRTVLVMSSLSGLPAGASISRIWLELYAKETAAVGDKIATLLHSGVTDVTGTAQSLTTAFARYLSSEYTTNPDTSGTWSVTEINSVQGGAIAE